MTSDMARIHVVFPERLLKRLDRLVGKRGRSSFIADAVAERIDRLELLEALEESAGSLDVSKHPHWKDRETTAEWVRSIRRGE